MLRYQEADSISAGLWMEEGLVEDRFHSGLIPSNAEVPYDVQFVFRFHGAALPVGGYSPSVRRLVRWLPPHSKHLTAFSAAVGLSVLIARKDYSSICRPVESHHLRASFRSLKVLV